MQRPTCWPNKLGSSSLSWVACATTCCCMPVPPFAHFLLRPEPPQGDLGLNICEAHAFNTKDRFSLDVFVVNGWAGGGTEELEEVLSRRLQELPPPVVRGASASPPANVQQPELRVPQDELDILAKVCTAQQGGGRRARGHVQRKAQAEVLPIQQHCVEWF